MIHLKHFCNKDMQRSIDFIEAKHCSTAAALNCALRDRELICSHSTIECFTISIAMLFSELIGYIILRNQRSLGESDAI